MADETPAKEKAKADAAKAAALGAKRGSRDPQVFVLLRELSEVHLLLDNVSANPVRTVSEEALVARPEDLDEKWIEKVCQISWPPDGSQDEKAEDAALLIRAKDHLNRLSFPASGATIAFTLLVTQGGTRKSWWRRIGGGGELSPTRSTLAQTAYPDLVAKAIGFRKWMVGISIGLLVALIMTCGFSWYVAYGNAALAELATAREALTKAQEQVDQAEAAESSPTGAGAQGAGGGAPAAVPATATPAAAAPGVSTAPEPYNGYCASNGYTSPTQAQLCGARTAAQQRLNLVETRLADWLCWDLISDCDNQAKVADAPARAAALATIMGTAMLPFLYGLLGAGAAIIRALARKIRTSRLSPRDLLLSFQQLALGAVVGACIGLFVGAPGSDAGGDNLVGPVTLSASAISFIAGFGVDTVFEALEQLIRRIFNIEPAQAANGTAQPR